MKANEHACAVQTNLFKECFLEIIFNFFESQSTNGVDYAYLDGSTKARKSQVELFQENNDVKVFLISLKASLLIEGHQVILFFFYKNVLSVWF